ncbi:hypothetical protein ACXGQW_10050 [Wenyingzhuangia sp. IMCC45533]
MYNEPEQNKHFSLDDLNLKKNPFKAPDNYFNELSSSIVSKDNATPLPKKTGFIAPKHYFDNFKVSPPKFKILKLVPYTSVAAAILVGFFLFNLSKNRTLSKDEIIDYLAIEANMYDDEILYHNIIDNRDLTNVENININIDELTLEIDDYDLIDF